MSEKSKQTVEISIHPNAVTAKYDPPLRPSLYMKIIPSGLIQLGGAKLSKGRAKKIAVVRHDDQGNDNAVMAAEALEGRAQRYGYKLLNEVQIKNKEYVPVNEELEVPKTKTKRKSDKPARKLQAKPEEVSTPDMSVIAGAMATNNVVELTLNPPMLKNEVDKLLVEDFQPTSYTGDGEDYYRSLDFNVQDFGSSQAEFNDFAKSFAKTVDRELVLVEPGA